MQNSFQMILEGQASGDQGDFRCDRISTSRPVVIPTSCLTALATLASTLGLLVPGREA